MENIKKIDLKEFIEIGFLQEANRLFFNPRGLALSIIAKENLSGEIRYEMGDIWDNRGVDEKVFIETINKTKTDNVEKVRQEQLNKRIQTDFCDENGIQIKNITEEK